MKIAICMVCRNIEKYLDKVFENIKKLMKYDITLIVEYDNCIDNTYEIIKKNIHQLKLKHKVINLIHNNSIYRTERISNARNACLEYLDTLEDIEYHIVLDPDDVNSKPWNINLIDVVLNSEKKWDAISFNGDNSKDTDGNYYDKWALLIDDFKWHVWGYGDFSPLVSQEMERYIYEKFEKNETIECYSAFNGFAIYKTKTFKGFRYCGRISQIDSKFFKKKDISKSIQFLKNRSYFLDIKNKSGLIPDVHFPLNSIKNQFSLFRESNNFQKILPDEICEHINYHLSAKLRGASIIISKNNICLE